MKSILLVFISIVLVKCTVALDETNANITADEVNDAQITNELKHSHELSLVLELPIKKGSYLEIQREDNWDYPKDFQVCNDTLYILSGEEKKIIGFDISGKQFLKYDKINQKLLSEKENNSISTPLFLRVTKDYIIIGYGFKLLIFSSTQEFLYKVNFEAGINYITVNRDTMNIWFKSYAEQFDLSNFKYDHKSHVEYISSEIGGESIIEDDGKIVTYFDGRTGAKAYKIENNTMIVEDIKNLPYTVLTDVKKESFSLNCITPTYYVWYPWTIGSKIVLINKVSGLSKVMDLGFKLTENNLYYEEDREEGLKITNEYDQLFFMIMVYDNGQKLIRVYQMDANG